MALPITPAIVGEKNKLASNGAWLVLLELIFPDPEEPIYLVNNTEDITWDSKTWERFSFDTEDVIEDGRGALPSFSINVSNVTRRFAKLIDEYAGARGATATLRVVHSDHLEEDPVFEEPYKVISAKLNRGTATFTLGAENPLNQRSPRQRYLMDSCRYKNFKGVLCGYDGGASTCDRTLEQCTSYGNDDRFGGFPSVSLGGFIA